MSLKRLVALLIVTVLLMAPASAYKGSKLARGPVEDFMLVDQNNETYSFDLDSQGVVVASFMFTRCPDVCPVITQSLKTAHAELSEREQDDVTFVSITVDPERDTPDVLAAYAQQHGVEWPHLTGSSDALEPVWETFGLVVQKAVIEAHTMAYQPGESSLTLATSNTTSNQHMFHLSASVATMMLAEERNWTLNVSAGDWGRMLHGIDGVDSPDDWSWYWELNVWNTTQDAWQPADVGMDEVDAHLHPHIAWMATTNNRSQLPAPPQDEALSMTVAWPNGSIDVANISALSGYHLTRGTLDHLAVPSSIEDSTYGHYLSSIDNLSAPEDYSWWWNLYVWNGSAEAWESSTVGMDELLEPEHAMWAPSYVNTSAVPSPISSNVDTNVCNGHGWHMGTGSAMHCMCDEGYGWDDGDQLTCIPETTEEYNVGHSTITYILNSDREPVVAWAGDDWRPEDLAADVRELLEKEQLGGHQAETTPSLPWLWSTGALIAALVLFSRKPQR